MCCHLARPGLVCRRCRYPCCCCYSCCCCCCCCCCYRRFYGYSATGTSSTRPSPTTTPRNKFSKRTRGACVDASPRQQTVVVVSLFPSACSLCFPCRRRRGFLLSVWSRACDDNGSSALAAGCWLLAACVTLLLVAWRDLPGLVWHWCCGASFRISCGVWHCATGDP